MNNLLHFPERPAPTKPAAAQRPMRRCSCKSNEIKYDYTNNTVAAVGNVQLYYNGATVEADEVIYDQKTKRLQARGNVRMTEADGKITYGQFIDLTQDYRDGFVDSLRLETADDTRFAATRADRVNGNYTVMQNGVYTACEPCKDDPKKPPLWQVEAARIVHDNGEKMLYFEDARVEFFGVPLMYFPFLSSPDPSVTRKSGFLYPTFTYGTAYGAGAEDRLFLGVGAKLRRDVGVTATTKQGALVQGIWRQRLMDGSYSIKAAGIFQQDPGYFANRDGPDSPTANTLPRRRPDRRPVRADRQVGVGMDRTADDGQPVSVRLSALPVLELVRSVPHRRRHRGRFSGLSHRRQRPQLFRYPHSLLLRLLGPGRAGADTDHPPGPRLFQRRLPQTVWGGELSYKFNLTSLTRQQAEFDAINQNAATNNLCTSNNPAVMNSSNCLLRGIAGTYSRASGEIDWRRTFVTDNGQMITPFFGVRGDVAQLDIENQAGTSNFINPGSSELARAMPDVGVEYRYPLIDVEPWGTQTIEPIAQLILRPNETQIGRWPNEDAQSVVFSDSNLFSVDKFSGWDRVEGGGRVNAGFQYTAQVNGAGSFNALFGQSYQIYGVNSFAAADLINTGAESGLDKTISDYVARLAYQPNQVFSFIAHGRFSSGGFDPGIGENVAAFTPERLEFETRANFDRWTFQLMYGDYAPQPEIGFLTRREEVLAGAAVKVTQNWVVMGSVRYDLAVSQFEQTRFGVGYTDDCFLLSLNYITSYIYTGTTPTPNNTFMFQFSLRTLGPEVLAPIATAF